MGLLDVLSEDPDLARPATVSPPPHTATPRPEECRAEASGIGATARNAFDAAVALTGVETLAELEAAMTSGIAPLGFTTAFLGEIRDGQVSFLAGNPCKAYVAHFLKCPTMIQDVIYRAILERRPAFFWSEIAARPNLTPVQVQMIEERAAFGFREGLISSLPHRDGRVTFVGMAGAHIDVADPEVRAAAHVLASCYGIASRRIAFAPTPPSVTLTPRQIDCLSWAREGKSTADIASILGISAHTAQEHISAACDRLGVRTRVQAVAAAQAMTLIPAGRLPASPRVRRLPVTT